MNKKLLIALLNVYNLNPVFNVVIVACNNDVYNRVTIRKIYSDMIVFGYIDNEGKVKHDKIHYEAIKTLSFGEYIKMEKTK